MVKWIGIGLAVVGVITVAFIVAAYLYSDFREATRDIAIVILALFQMIGALLTIALLFAILYAVRSINNLASQNVVPKIDLLTDKLNQVLDSSRSLAENVRDTTGAAKTTSVYVAEQVVAPVIRVSSLFAGVRAAAGFLARRGAPHEPDNI